MKKFLTFLLTAIFSIATGLSGTIVFGDLNLENGIQYSDPFDGGDFTVTFGGGGNDGKYYNTGEGIRVYGNGTMTVAAKSDNITEIVVTYSDGTNKPTTNNVVNVGTYNSSTNTWTGSASSVVFTRPSGNGHWRVKALAVTTSSSTSVATPSISGTTPFVSSTEVTLTCTTSEASIYYTTDGTDPDNTSTLYNGNPFILRNTATVKAIAYKNNNHSSVVLKEFVKCTTVGTLSDMKALADNTEFVFTGEAQCIQQHGYRIWIQDNTAGTLIYGTIPNNIIYNVTDIIPAGWMGKKTTYNNFPEVTNPSNFEESEEQRHSNGTEINLGSINSNDVYKYVVAKNVLITVNNTPQPTGNTVVFDFNNDLSSLGLSTPNVGKGIELSAPITYNGITMNYTNGSTPTRIWNSSGTTTLRVYKDGGSLTFTVATGNITKIVFNGSKVVGNVNVGTFSNKIWAGSANSITLTMSGDNSTINTITFTVDTGTSLAPTLRTQTTTGNITLTDEQGNTITGYTGTLNGTNNPLQIPDDLTKRYDVYGILDYYSGTPRILPMGFVDPDTGVVTGGINDIKADVKSVKYINLAGIESSKPFDGLNIMVITYTDGHKVIKKILNRF